MTNESDRERFLKTGYISDILDTIQQFDNLTTSDLQGSIAILVDKIYNHK